MENKKIVLLAGIGTSSNIIFHALTQKFNIEAVIIEAKENRKIFLKRRIKKLGFFTVTGQVLFQLIVVPVLNFLYKKKIKQNIKDRELDDSNIPAEKILAVTSINDAKVALLLKSIQPDAIVVNGTRIISKKILASVSCPVINTHTGITPMYRGVHGGYWAMVNKDPDHCGVTIHLVDAGIDTGDVLYQSSISVSDADSFSTYPIKQIAAGIPLLLKAVDDALKNQLKPYIPTGKSQLWYHPTIIQYLYNLIFYKVK
ncbi:formyl transferase [soil metagenome]